jgi:hypothetical protein
VLRHKTPDGISKRLIAEEEFEDTIGSVFGIRDPDIRSLWPRVQARHHAVFGNAPIEQLNITGF